MSERYTKSPRLTGKIRQDLPVIIVGNRVTDLVRSSPRPRGRDLLESKREVECRVSVTFEVEIVECAAAEWILLSGQRVLGGRCDLFEIDAEPIRIRHTVAPFSERPAGMEIRTSSPLRN